MRLKLINIIAALALTGCATANWQHPKISDKNAMAKQLVIDDGYCTRVANGSAPMPQIVAPETPTTTTFNASGTTYNSSTGERTYGNYSGQATTIPSGGFGGGFASGMASGASLGAAINARRAYDRIHKSCMYTKGWLDIPVGTTAPEAASNSSSAPAALAPAIAAKKPLPVQPVKAAQIYASPAEQWQADVDEFYVFYPAYRTGLLHQWIDGKVRVIAKESPHMSGPLILIAAHASLKAASQAAREPTSKTMSRLLSFYHSSSAGDAMDQVALGTEYLQESNLPFNQKRSAYWVQQSALSGNSLGQQVYGLMLFKGEGVAQDRVEGYRFIEKASLIDSDARKLLTDIRPLLTSNELAQAR